MQLGTTGLAVSRLGFGCSGLMARLDARDSARLLRTALDCGITHFDTARLYGYGAAERVLGEVIGPIRDQVTITSKVGILPPSTALPGMGTVRALARRAARFCPPLRPLLRRRAQALVRSGVFDIATLASSLDTSLRELRIDYLDILLLHDCPAAELERPELLDFLVRARRDGKLRHFGLGTSPADTEEAIARHPAFTSIVQIPSSIWNRNVERIAPSPQRGIFTHSVLGPRFATLCDALSASAGLRREWSEELGLDAGDRSALARLFLAHALEANAAGVVLFSSSIPANIRESARALDPAMVTPAQLAALAKLVARSPLQEPAA